MKKTPQHPIIDGTRVLKASNVKTIHSIYLKLAESFATIEELKFIKIYNERIKASNLLSQNKKKDPITEIGKEGVVGVELLIDTDSQIIQFYSLTSEKKGNGRKIVESVVNAAPDDWKLVVVMDWSSGFWYRMIEDFPRIVVF